MSQLENAKIGDPCPCGSGKEFNDCCQLFLSGSQMPSTPEQLMRSRYTAFQQGANTYLYDTSSSKLKSAISMDELQEATDSSLFFRLDVLNSNHFSVEFKAHFFVNDEYHVLHEHSTFVSEDGNWKYDIGELFPTAVVRVKSNELCPCGSGKKFKRCHKLNSTHKR